MKAYNGNQPGDPEKAVARVIDVVKQEGVAAGRCTAEVNVGTGCSGGG